MKKEGDKCECGGTFEFPPVVECWCHIAQPCGACVDNRLACDSCGIEDEDECCTDE
jgi:hypothetical protein